MDSIEFCAENLIVIYYQEVDMKDRHQWIKSVPTIAGRL